MAEKKRFRVREGQHFEAVVPAGSRGPFDMGEYTRHVAVEDATKIVESDRDLDVVFPNKFERIQEGITRSLAAQEVRNSAINELIHTGQWTEEDRSMLNELSDAGFGRIVARTGSLAATKAQQQPVAAATEGLAEEQKRDAQAREAERVRGQPQKDAELEQRSQEQAAQRGKQAKKSPLGEDVTDRFLKAEDLNVKVWANPAGKHQVTERDGKKPINDRPMEAAEVEPFLDELLDARSSPEHRQE